ncbi:MAG: inositol monophosphatase [Anaerolineaceae bacterium]|nr:inositol monophosphatase [Anaerolineaceae bacterium]
MNPSLDDLKELARGAGQILREGYEQDFAVQHKGRIDLVTEMDQRSEAYLLGQIQSRFPGHSIVAEESGRLAGAEDTCWHVDPLDGTVNYAHGVPVFSVSIAFVQGGVTQLGVVYDPMRDELFSAERGCGACMNEKPIRVSMTTDLLQSLLTTGFSYYDLAITHNLAHYQRFAHLTQGVRRLGSAAIDLCYVAAGRFEGYWEISLQSYDIAAGGLIVEEAGGITTATYGDSDYLRAPCSVLAANPVLHAQMLAVLLEDRPA